ncbi:MAG: hypothetical protein IPI67_22670 [Myxococcales bacterium]|nr:hypothetical protein [Myxococcales bacterium]
MLQKRIAEARLDEVPDSRARRARRREQSTLLAGALLRLVADHRPRRRSLARAPRAASKHFRCLGSGRHPNLMVDAHARPGENRSGVSLKQASEPAPATRDMSLPMVGRSWLLGLVLLMGCGGGGAAAPEAKAPDESETPAKPAASAASEDTPSEAPDDSAGKPKEDAPAASEPLSKEDLEGVLQQLMNDPELADYLQLKKSGRLPLKVFGEGLPPKLSVTIGSYDLKVVGEPKSKKDPVLVFTKIERDGTSVRLRYRFDAEGVTGSAVVHQSGGVWRLGANRVMGK